MGRKHGDLGTLAHRQQCLRCGLTICQNQGRRLQSDNSGNASRAVLRGGVRQQVAGELFARELVEWFVSVEGLDHVITPGPVCARGVGLKAIGVGVAGGIQPPHGHALAKVRGLQKTVQHYMTEVARLQGSRATPVQLNQEVVRETTQNIESHGMPKA